MRKSRTVDPFRPDGYLHCFCTQARTPYQKAGIWDGHCNREDGGTRSRLIRKARSVWQLGIERQGFTANPGSRYGAGTLRSESHRHKTPPTTFHLNLLQSHLRLILESFVQAQSLSHPPPRTLLDLPPTSSEHAAYITPHPSTHSHTTPPPASPASRTQWTKRTK